MALTEIRPLARWLTATACLRGLNHEADGTPCQDRVDVVERDGTLCVAVADGAGSAKHAELGARHVAARTCQLLTGDFDGFWARGAETLATTMLEALLAHLLGVASEHAARPPELASTLLFVAVKDRRYIAGNLGDGVVACAGRDGSEVIFHPRRGEFANETFFVTSANAAHRLDARLGRTDGIDSFFLMTDGAAELLYDRGGRELATAAPKIAAWLETHPPSAVAKALTKNLDKLRRGRTGDDCSVAVVRRVETSVDALRASSAAYRRAFLGSGTVRGADNRLRVAAALDVPAAGAAASLDVSRALGLAPRTVSRHARAISALRVES